MVEKIQALYEYLNEYLGNEENRKKLQDQIVDVIDNHALLDSWFESVHLRPINEAQREQIRKMIFKED